jgi:hypothetical protein
MEDVPTNVTVLPVEENKFKFALHFSDAFEGDELVPAVDEFDGTLVKAGNGAWQIEGESKVSLAEEDIQNLGAAIQRDYLEKNS